jgi:exopolyphosphatase / guanosine-5'-triphosphate,3'-diphosphate pyrophosphatase
MAATRPIFRFSIRPVRPKQWDIVKVGVVDVGSHTVRLLVAEHKRGALEPVWEERAALGLGAEVERLGLISREKLEETSDHVRGYARLARKAGAEVLEVIVTAPGRQSSNGRELVLELARATGVPVRVLSADEEGRLAFAGAIAVSDLPGESIAVCDVGGGSTEVVVGTRFDGPAWLRSFDVGAVRLSGRYLFDDPPGKADLDAARAEVAAALERLTPPLPQCALATGGSARALRKLVGSNLGPDELEAALAISLARPAVKVAKAFGIDRERARTLPAGVLILSAVQERLSVPLQVVRAGLREGAVLALLQEAAAA